MTRSLIVKNYVIVFFACFSFIVANAQEQPRQPEESAARKACGQSQIFCDLLEELSSGDKAGSLTFDKLISLLESSSSLAYDDITGSEKSISFALVLGEIKANREKYRIKCWLPDLNSGIKYFEIPIKQRDGSSSKPEDVLAVPIQKKVNGKKREGYLLVRVNTGKIFQYTNTIPERFNPINYIFPQQPRSRGITQFIQVCGNNLTPFGLRYGLMPEKLGIYIYIEGRISPDPFVKTPYTFSLGELRGLEDRGYVELNQDNHYSAYSIAAGPIIHIKMNWSGYFGVGYGKQDYLLGVNRYDYPDILLDKTTARYVDYSVKGFEVTGGVLLNFKRFNMSLGFQSIGFKSINWVVGIGYCFNAK